MNRSKRANFSQDGGLANWLAELFATPQGKPGVGNLYGSHPVQGQPAVVPAPVVAPNVAPGMSQNPDLDLGVPEFIPGTPVRRVNNDVRRNYQVTGDVNDPIANAMNAPIEPAPVKEYNPLMMQGEGGYSDSRWQRKINDQKVARGNKYQKGKNWQNDMTNAIDAVVNETEPVDPMEILATVQAGQTGVKAAPTAPVATKKSASKKTVKRKTKAKAKVKAVPKVRASSAQEAINKAAGGAVSPVHAAMMGNNFGAYGANDDYGITY